MRVFAVRSRCLQTLDFVNEGDLYSCQTSWYGEAGPLFGTMRGKFVELTEE